jgi:hypothetical protein
MRAVRLILCCSALFVMGCGSSSTPTNPVSPGEEADVDDNQAKADGTTYPLGTYRITDESDDTDYSRVDTLAIKTDGTFYRYEKGMSCDPDGNCQEGVNSHKGTYKFCKTTSGGACVRFYDEDGKLIDRLLYALKGSNLTTQYNSKGYQSELVHATDANVWCHAATDCSIQGYGNPRCVEGWMCGFHAECLQCLMPAWIDSVMSAYTSQGTSALPEVSEADLPERAQQFFAADRERFGTHSYYKPADMKFYKMTVEAKTAYVSEMKSDGTVITDVFDEMGQWIASGCAQPGIRFSWDQLSSY